MTSTTLSTTLTFTRYELLRSVRNRRLLLFSLGFPLLMFFLIAGPNRHERLGGIAFPAYYMSGMLAWGAMAAVLGGGARIAAERSIGWHRQLRITPLPSRTYFGTKVASGYAMAGVTIALLYAAGLGMGVRMSLGAWFEMTGLVLVALVPFAVLGILMGHVLTIDSMGPALGGVTSLLAILGGSWAPVASGGVAHAVATALPSYWLVQAGHAAIGGGGWPVRAWVVIALWTAVLARITRVVYRRDTVRV